MNQDEMIKNIAEKSLHYFTRLLKLPHIPMEIIDNPKSKELGRANFNTLAFNNVSIQINLSAIKGICDSPENLQGFNKRLKTKVNDIFDVTIQTVAHELGHCFQMIRYPRWTRKYIGDYKRLAQREVEFYDYLKFKMELNANRIADILQRKLVIQYE